MKLETQLHIGLNMPCEDTWETIRNDQHGRLKPRGGLWTSTYEEQEHTSAWVEFCVAENYDTPYHKQWYLLTPRQDVRLAVVDTEDDLCLLFERYKYILVPGIDLYELDFEAMSNDYDAMHLTHAGQWRTRLSLPYNLYGWDVESTVWFRWCFTKVEQIATTPMTLEPTP